MKARTLISKTPQARVRTVIFLMLVLTLSLVGPNPSRSYSTPATYSVSIREADAQGTTHLAADYQSPQLGQEYRANRPMFSRQDTYVQDEVILHFRPGVSQAQRNALMAAHGMSFSRRIYGADPSLVIVKVNPHAALALANALEHNPLLSGAGVDPIMKPFSDPPPNDPLFQSQQNLTTTNQINALGGWGYGHGLGQVSLIAIVDSAIYFQHPDIQPKYNQANWKNFCNSDDPESTATHGTNVAGLAIAATNNALGIASTGYSAWPMSLRVWCSADEGGVQGFPASLVTSAFNYAADHGASVINLSAGCLRNVQVGCNTKNPVIQEMRGAVDRAYARGISIVVAGGNGSYDTPTYPAAFGQISEDPDLWLYNESLVTAVSGTYLGLHDPATNYGTWHDVGAPSRQDDDQGVWTTGHVPLSETLYIRFGDSSAAAPQVAGLASLLTSLGYSNYDVWNFITQGATDLPCEPEPPSGCGGYDPYTGWGRINMGDSMALAHRTTPGMMVVPNAGYSGMQWFNAQGSGFNEGQFPRIDICWTAPGGGTTCSPTEQFADEKGVVGLGIQVGSTESLAPTGVWTVSMCYHGNPSNCATGTFTVIPTP